MAITITEKAAQKVNHFLSMRGKGLGIRILVKPSGCNGFSYVLEYVDTIDAADKIFEDNGIKIVTNDKSLVYLEGLKIDYVKKGINEGFEFVNGNEKGRCGCGSSFNV